MPNMLCPRCGNKKSWLIRRHKRKCSACKYEWRPDKLPLQISRPKWQLLIQRFLASKTVTATATEINLGRGQVLRAFGIIRTAMSLDTPGEFTAYSNGSREPAYVHISCYPKYNLGKRQIFTDKSPIASLDGVIALVYHHDRVWGRLISGQTGYDLEKLMHESAGKTIPWSPILDGYTGVITKTSFYHFKPEGKTEDASPFWVGHGIWVELKSLIAEKHGIRREQLPLYLGEVIWRSNFEDPDETLQRKRIFSLIQGYKLRKIIVPGR